MKEDKISVKNYLEYLDAKYPNESSSNWNSSFVYMKAEEEFKFFISLIRKIIESSSEISDEDNIYVRRFFDLLVNEYWDKLQEEKTSNKTKTLEDKLKIAELFEYTEN